MVIQKGEEGFDHSKDEPFFYERDALFIGYDEKTGGSYIYIKGAWIGRAGSD